MSGILGIYNLDDRSVNRQDLMNMTDVLTHRGTDGFGIWQEGAIGLGHRMLWTTAESLLEELPMQRNGLAITADARIDNRDELIETLGLQSLLAEKITDSDLILAAYQQWDRDCPNYLLGDFAFAIWDETQQHLFCARDHFGVKPFYYYCSETTFAFASEIKGIFCLLEVPKTLNETRIADYLVPMFHDTEITSYQHIFRLPPAHHLTLRPAEMQIDRYWKLDESRNIQFSSDEEYATEFRRIFTEAVRCRLRSAFPIGSELSGGLDSSSITCVSRKLLEEGSLHTFSAVFDRLTECDERQYIEPVLALGKVQSHYFIADDQSPLQHLDKILWHQEEAFFAPNHFMGWGLNGVVQAAGVRVLLSGFDGDTTVSDGYGYLGDLARAGRWWRFIEEAKPLTKAMDIPLTKWLKSYFHHFAVKPIFNRYRWLKLPQRLWQWILPRRAVEVAVKSAWDDMVDSRLMQQVGLAQRYQAWQQAESKLGQTQREQHYKAIRQGLIPFALEVQDKDAAAFGFETRYPFWDKRLVEFCLAIPAGQKLSQGWNRSVLRRAMTDILPPEVQWRRGKANFAPNLVRGLLNDRAQLEDLGTDNLLQGYVNSSEFQKSYQTFLTQTFQTDTNDVFKVWTVISLGLWLRYISQNNPTCVHSLSQEAFTT